MKPALCLAAVVAAGADQCCHNPCDASDCSPEGDWCAASQTNCEGSCGGHFCPSGPHPSPTPAPPGSPTPSPPSGHGVYCPDASSFGTDGSAQMQENGWSMTGNGGVHSTVTWNLNGGYVEFDMDTSGAHPGVNTNLYTTSPDHVQGTNECDIQGQGKPSCMEMDIIEMNGNCAAASTVHTWPNNNGGCDRGGCASIQHVGGKFHVKAEFSPDGWMTVVINGNKNENYNPSPSANCKANVVENFNNKGGQIQSSQWVGWVPAADQCPGGSDLGSSHFSISNLQVKGKVVQGSEPKRCSGEQLARAARSAEELIARAANYSSIIV